MEYLSLIAGIIFGLTDYNWDSTSLVIAIVIVLFLIKDSIRVIPKNSCGIVYRIGRLIKLERSGIILVIPFIDHLVRVKLGETGVALTEINPAGEFRAYGYTWKARASDKHLKHGDEGRVVDIEANHEAYLIVEKIDDD